MKTLKALFILFLAFACEQEKTFRIDSRLQPYYDSFLNEAKKRNFTAFDDYSNLIMALHPGLVDGSIDGIKALGMTRKHPGGQHTIYIDEAFFLSHPDKIEILVFHELGHCYLDRSHNMDYSIMNIKYSANGWPICNGDSSLCASKNTWMITELFYHAGN